LRRAYRTGSWDIHAGPRAFLTGTWTTHEDGRVSYDERLPPEKLLTTRALAVGIVASTVQLIAGELGLAQVEQEASDIITTVMAIPPQGDGERSSYLARRRSEDLTRLPGVHRGAHAGDDVGATAALRQRHM
jgi:hypothetical protein